MASGAPAERPPTGRSAGERLRRRALDTAERVDAGTAGQVRRRVRDLGLSHHALVFSALAMVLFVPALISLSAVLPLGSEHGLADRLAHHLALSAEARRAIRELFAREDAIRTTTSAVGAVFTVLAAYAWPAELQRFYAAVWALPAPRVRHMWRALVWLASLVGVIAVVAVVGSLAGGIAGTLLTAILCSPVVVLWLWWSQWFLLAGRMSWSALLPGALVTSAAMVAFSVATSVYLSRAIIWNAERYGPIGVVFVLMSWLTWFSTVLLGGALVGHAVHARRPSRPAPGSPRPGQGEGRNGPAGAGDVRRSDP